MESRRTYGKGQWIAAWVMVGLAVICLVTFLSGLNGDGGGGSDDGRNNRSIYQILRDGAGSDLIKGASISGGTLDISVSLRRSPPDAFFEDIGTIHGAVVEADPKVETVVLRDISGQRITISMDAMRDFYYDRIEWDEFRATWEVVNP